MSLLAGRFGVLLFVPGERSGGQPLGSFLRPPVREEAGVPRAGCVGEGLLGPGVAGVSRKEKDARAAASSLASMGGRTFFSETVASTAPGGTAPSRPWPRGLGGGRRSERRRGHRALGGAGPESRAASLRGRGWPRADFRPTGPCSSHHSEQLCDGCLPGLPLSRSLKWG